MRDNRTIIVIFGVGVIVIGLVFFVLTGGKTKNTDVVNVSEAPKSTNTTAAVDDGSGPATATVESAAIAPDPKEGLEATDPGTVELASGDLLFVEAFDFY